jgi:uncharacterized protein (TIGR03435 family)
MIALVADHLWQSTLFAGIVGLLMLLLRHNRPQVRYALWLAASVKFLVPFAALVAIGTQVGWRSSATIARAPFTLVIDSWDAIGQPFSRPAPTSAPATTSAIVASWLPILLVTMWFIGCAAILLTWVVRWRRVAAAVRAASLVDEGRELEMLRRLEPIAGIAQPITLLSSDTSLEPGVFGISKPVLLWPRSIAAHLDDEQVESILAHELTHVRRRDNLAAAVHMIVQALFWFHPLVWWIGARLVDERERACDAEVVRLGSDPRVYAESILKTCELYVESPLVCVSGVTGSDLKKRIEQIMKNDAGATLNAWRKILLTVAAVVAIVGPIAVGVLSSPRLRAQSSSADALGPAFAVVSVKANTSGDSRSYPVTMGPDGRFAVKNVTMRWLIGVAYQAFGSRRLEGGPNWLDADRFDIDAKAEGNPTGEQMRSMVRRLLVDRLELAVHNETRELPVYALVLARSDGALGPRLRPSACAGKDTAPFPPGPIDPNKQPPLPCGTFRARPTGQMQARWLTMAEFAQFGLRGLVGRRVLDRTGLTGYFDLELDFSPEPMAPPPPVPSAPVYGRNAPFIGPAFFVAAEEQLGLSLASETGPVEFLVIDRAEKPVQP